MSVKREWSSDVVNVFCYVQNKENNLQLRRKERHRSWHDGLHFAGRQIEALNQVGR